MRSQPFPLPRPLAQLCAPAGWARVDLLSDIHLSPDMPATLARFEQHLRASPADAFFLLGDIFEAWIGDDARWEAGSFEQHCANVLRLAARGRPLYFLHGNRDFMLGQAMADEAGLRLQDDPLCLQAFGQRWLLSHGDALCLDDLAYQRARAQVRRPLIQALLRLLPLSARRALARHLRQRSRSHQQDPALWADVDEDACRDWLRASGCQTLIHGHTHRPGLHSLGGPWQRVVLSDWDYEPSCSSPRGDVLVLDAQGLHRIAPMMA